LLKTAGDYINFNGTIIRSGIPVISPENRGFRYGDGIFETMRVENDLVRFPDYHLDRLFSGIQLLAFDVTRFLSRDELLFQVVDLCRRNGQSHARARLVVFRGNGGLYDTENHDPNYIIETWAIEPRKRKPDENGLRIDVFPGGRKSADVLSNVKSNNYLLYALGALYAKKNSLDDCLILNQYDRVCDSTISNVFCVRGETIFTPPLTEGCVSGVVRRHLLKELPGVEEKEIEVDWLIGCDEIFLTNAISGVRWVRNWGEKEYENKVSSTIYEVL